MAKNDYRRQYSINKNLAQAIDLAVAKIISITGMSAEKVKKLDKTDIFELVGRIEREKEREAQGLHIKFDKTVKYDPIGHSEAREKITKGVVDRTQLQSGLSQSIGDCIKFIVARISDRAQENAMLYPELVNKIAQRAAIVNNTATVKKKFAVNQNYGQAAPGKNIGGL